MQAERSAREILRLHAAILTGDFSHPESPVELTRARHVVVVAPAVFVARLESVASRRPATADAVRGVGRLHDCDTTRGDLVRAANGGLSRGTHRHFHRDR